MDESLIQDDITEKYGAINSFLENEKRKSERTIQTLQNEFDEYASKTEFENGEKMSIEVSNLRSAHASNKSRVEFDNIEQYKRLEKTLDDKKSEYAKMSDLEKQIEQRHKEAMAEIDTDITDWEKLKTKEIRDEGTRFAVLKNQYQENIKYAQQLENEKTMIQDAKKAQEAAENKAIANSASNDASNNTNTNNTNSKAKEMQKKTVVLETPLGKEEIDENTYKIYLYLIIFTFVIIISLIIYKNFRAKPLLEIKRQQEEKQKLINILHGPETA